MHTHTHCILSIVYRTIGQSGKRTVIGMTDCHRHSDREQAVIGMTDCHRHSDSHRHSHVDFSLGTNNHCLLFAFEGLTMVMF